MSGYRVADDVAWAQADGDEPCVGVALLPDGPPYVLTGSSAQIWLGAAPGGDMATVVDRVADTAGLAAAEIADDVRALLEGLVALGLLVVEEAE